MIPLPDHVEGKIGWADHHSKLIKDEVLRYEKTKPYFVTADFDPDPVSERVVDEPAAQRGSASRRDDVAPGFLLALLSQPLTSKTTP